MHALWGRMRWRVAVAASAVLAFLALVAHEESWAELGVDHIKPYYFLDLSAILAAGQAAHAGLDPYTPPNHFDPLGRPHVYGPWWLAAGWLGLTTADARWLGPLLALAFFASAAVVLAPRRPGAALVAVALVVSPPVLLGVERGNNDLVIFLLLAAAGALLARGARGAGWGAGLLGLAAVLKIYPLVALVSLGARAAARRRVLVGLAVVGAVCGLVFLLWRADYTRAMVNAPRPDTFFSYGLRVAVWGWRGSAAVAGWQLAAVGVTAAVAGGFIFRQRRVLWGAVPVTGAVAAWFVAGAAAWSFCYLTNTNYPYRAVLLLLPARLWLDGAGNVGAATDAARGRVARAQLAACVVMLWLLPLKSWAVNGVDGGGAGADAGLALVLGVEQALVAAVTVALLISLAGWGWRRWRAGDGAGVCAGAVAADG